MGICDISLEIGADGGAGLWFPEPENKSDRGDRNERKIDGGDAGWESFTRKNYPLSISPLSRGRGKMRWVDIFFDDFWEKGC